MSNWAKCCAQSSSTWAEFSGGLNDPEQFPEHGSKKNPVDTSFRILHTSSYLIKALDSMQAALSQAHSSKLHERPKLLESIKTAQNMKGKTSCFIHIIHL